MKFYLHLGIKQALLTQCQAASKELPRPLNVFFFPSVEKNSDWQRSQTLEQLLQWKTAAVSRSGPPLTYSHSVLLNNTSHDEHAYMAHIYSSEPHLAFVLRLVCSLKLREL